MRAFPVAGTLVIAAAVAPSTAQWTFTRIANSSTLVPGSAGAFQTYGLPAIDNGVVGFSGFHSFPAPAAAGVFRGSGGPLATVANLSTTIPNGTGNFIGFAGVEEHTPSLSGGATAFIGDGAGTSFIQRGIYLREGSTLTRIIDRATPIPNSGGATFFDISPPSLEGGRVAFIGGEFVPGHRGAYSWQAGVLSVAADSTTPVPNGPGLFTDFFDCALDQGQMVFSGSSGSHQGVYRVEPGGSLTALYDSNTQVPGGNGGDFATLSRVGLSDGRIVFWGQGAGQAGIYSDVSGQLEVIADLDTPVPGNTGTFSGFGGVSIDDGVIAFSGLRGGLLGLYSTHGGSLQKVLDFGDPLDGRIVSDAIIGTQSLDGDSIAVKVFFTNGTWGIYMATIPAPATAVTAGMVLAVAARRRRR